MKSIFIFFTLVTCFFCWPLQAAYQEYGGKWIKEKYVPYLPLEEHLELARSYLQKQDWPSAYHQFQILLHNSLSEETYAEALFGFAQCEFHLALYEEANEHLSDYLREIQRDHRYNDIIQLKFQIAQKFRQGAKRRPFGWSKMPRILSAKDLAIKIFDEVAIALPRSDLAAQALISKAQMQRRKRDFSSSNQALQQVISEFDRHPLVLQAFEEQARTYLVEMRTTSRSEELLELARINRQKMAARFPNADFSKVDAYIHSMRELYAQSLFDGAQLYHKKGYKEASRLYLLRLVQVYPETKAAQIAHSILSRGSF